MEVSDETKELFDKLRGIQINFNFDNYIVSKEELMAVVLDKAPSEYAIFLSQEYITQGINLAMVHLKNP